MGTSPSTPTEPVALQVTSRHIGDDRRLLSMIPDMPEDTPLSAWSTVHPTHGRDEGLVGWGTAVRIDVGPGNERFRAATAALQAAAAAAAIDDPVQARGSGLVAFGSFTFDDNAAGSVLHIPRVIVGRRGHTTWLTSIDPLHGDTGPTPPSPRPANQPIAPAVTDRPRYAGATASDVRWLESVAAAVEHIRAGRADKVVLARDLAVWSRQRFEPAVLARRLQDHFPQCHTFVVDNLVGATPELLLSRDGLHVTSRVLAGTTGRAAEQAVDDQLGADLLSSAKDRHEHTLAVDSVRDVLAPVCDQLTWDDEPVLLRLENVQHLATWFDGRLKRPLDALELVGALHPTAAVGGTPRSAALSLIEQLEDISRGRYAAPVGWVDPHGDGEWGIALRCAEVNAHHARLFAGVGVVDGSLPEAELAETRLKLLAMQAVLGS